MVRLFANGSSVVTDFILIGADALYVFFLTYSDTDKNFRFYSKVYGSISPHIINQSPIYLGPLYWDERCTLLAIYNTFFTWR